MTDTVFLTGFPGFLGSALVTRLLDRYDDATVTCLVQPKYHEEAQARAADIEADAGTDGRIRLVDGDITDPDLGLDDAYDDLQAATVEVYHLAAVYDLAVSREVGMAVNARGTRHVLDFAEGAPDLRRFQYVSTCYVSGRYDGLYAETDLDVGQTFNNQYEATKFLAEREIQDRMADGLPATVYRPAITVGDSRTGATQKYDGPYYILQWLLRQPRVAVVPVVGDPDRYEVNLVPRDYVVDAIAHLSGLDRSEGEVYQLCDPNPPTVAQLLSLFADATDRRVLPVPTTPRLARFALERVPGVHRLLRIEPATIDYFVHPTSYACGNAARDLRDTDIAPPPLDTYVDTLVAYVREHPDISPDAMV